MNEVKNGKKKSKAKSKSLGVTPQEKPISSHDNGRIEFERRKDGFGIVHRSDNHQGRGPKGYRRSDVRIREDVCEALQSDPDIDASEIEVEVKNQVVILRGTTSDRITKKMAEECVDQIGGVEDVRNEIVLDKMGRHREKDYESDESEAV